LVYFGSFGREPLSLALEGSLQPKKNPVWNHSIHEKHQQSILIVLLEGLYVIVVRYVVQKGNKRLVPKLSGHILIFA
jgi:hypothetical protein